MNHSWVHLIVFHPVQHNPKPCTVLRKASLTRAVSHPRPDIHVNASGIGYILGLMLQLVELISQQMIGDDIHLVSKPSNLYVSEASRLLSTLGHAPCALAARAALAAALALSRASSLRLAAMGARRAAIVSDAARASAGLLTKAGMLPFSCPLSARGVRAAAAISRGGIAAALRASVMTWARGDARR